MAKFLPVDRAGKRHGKLVVLERVNEKNKGGCYRWICQCDCGNVVLVSGDNLRDNGGTQSCGHCVSRAMSIEEYEAKKKEELSAITNAWEYVRCKNREKVRSVIKCVVCGKEKIVGSFNNISDCCYCKREQAKQEKELSKYKTCVVCGVTFKPARSTAKYCSEACSKKAYNERHIEEIRERHRINKRLREARIKGNGKIDYSITLVKLIERDNHVCCLCGREVNENDYIYIGDIFIAGNDYPSIDHIKPLSKGGLHQWNNVQLAHRLCNSMKCDK